MNRYTRPLNSCAVFDPAIATRNAGDEIISDAVRHQLRRVLPDAFQAMVPTHERIGARTRRFSKQARHRIIGGSNILTAHMMLDRQRRLRPWDVPFVNDLICLGVGWRNYGQSRSWISDVMLRAVLSKTGLHSTRDEHTRQELLARGVRNVVNTACVTMWDLELDALAALPPQKAHRVITTLNIGRKSRGDIEMLQLLCEEYDEVFIWPQGIDDEPYIAEVVALMPKIRPIGPTLAAYDELLASAEPLDFVGNRLHAGIRALQHKRRALILSVDNRASEIARDTNLPVVSLADGVERARARLRAPEPIAIKLPYETIAEWRGQFGG